jgi:sodium/potassium-transporting ATPase subunit alpha
MIAKRMAKSKVLVKNLATIETLSCVNVIASDKTGTLTQNIMFVGNALAGLESMNLKAADVRLKEGIATKQLVAAASLCNNAHFEETDAASASLLSKARQRKQSGSEKSPKNGPDYTSRKAIGDATDIALLRFASQNSGDFPDLPAMYEVTREVPFNSRNKWMMKTVRPRNANIHNIIFGHEISSESDMMLIKGAPDILLPKCNRIVQTDGNEIALSELIMSQITHIQNEWCRQGQRVIVLCKRECCEGNDEPSACASTCQQEAFVSKCQDFCFIGMLGIIDPPRTGIKDVIGTCRQAGIRVLMITGDYALTAAAIAKEIGIFGYEKFDTVKDVHEKFKLGIEVGNPVLGMLFSSFPIRQVHNS